MEFENIDIALLSTNLLKIRENNRKKNPKYLPTLPITFLKNTFEIVRKLLQVHKTMKKNYQNSTYP